ncbi:16S rRNA (adenine(1518)-N(6)/adenine(1519)-N(6))-dimethyltransferase, partial [Streptomyces kronopolitis]
GSAAAAEAALVAAGVSPQARGEALTVEEFARIAEHRGPGGAPGIRQARGEQAAGGAQTSGGEQASGGAAA